MTAPEHQPPPPHDPPYLAHLDANGKSQLLADHLFSVSRRAAHSAAKIHVASAGQLVGLVHDLGKDFGSAKTVELACSKWMDVRAFGQLFALPKKAKGKGADDEAEAGVSIPIRGPVTVQSAFSVQPVDVSSTQITKSVSSEGDGSKRGSDTMGMKHRVDAGVYVFYGSMNPQLAERTGFSDEDADTIKNLLPKLFENDASSARPDGSMEILKVIWWKHHSKAGQHSSAKVHRSLKMNPDGTYNLEPIEGLKPEEIPGF
jgi:CRISPR-associated protein Csd2